jgi:hypothetical protein
MSGDLFSLATLVRHAGCNGKGIDLYDQAQKDTIVSELHLRQPRKIPKGEWEKIAEQHITGEPIASIARRYQCTPPAIRYILRQQGKITAPKPVDPRPKPFVPPGETPSRRVGTTTRGNFDANLRDAIMVGISAFLVVFDAASRNSSTASLEALRKETDQLLRAIARVRIEIERVQGNTIPLAYHEEAPKK